MVLLMYVLSLLHVPQWIIGEPSNAVVLKKETPETKKFSITDTIVYTKENCESNTTDCTHIWHCLHWLIDKTSQQG